MTLDRATPYRIGVWRPGGYKYRRTLSIEKFLRRLAFVLIMASGVYNPNFHGSSAHRATFTGVLRPSFSRVQQLNCSVVIHQTHIGNPCSLQKKVLPMSCLSSRICYHFPDHCVLFYVLITICLFNLLASGRPETVEARNQ